MLEPHGERRRGVVDADESAKQAVGVAWGFWLTALPPFRMSQQQLNQYLLLRKKQFLSIGLKHFWRAK